MSENVTVFQLAKEFEIKALELIDKIKPLDLKIKNHMSELTAEEAEKIRTFLSPTPQEPAKKVTKKKTTTRKKTKEAAAKPSVVITRTKRAVSPDSSEETTKIIRRKRKSSSSGSAEYTIESMAEETAGGESIESLEATNLSPETSPDVIAESPELQGAEGTLMDPPEEMPITEELSPEAQEAATETLGAPSTLPEGEVVEASEETSTAASAPASTAGTTAPPRRTARFSVIRVVSPEPAVRSRPLIVEDAPAGAERTYGRTGRAGSVPKTFSDPELARTGSSLIRQAEEEESRRKKASPSPRRTDDQNFKSTDYLRRERVYQPKKKKISLGMAQKKTQITVASAHKRIVSYDTEMSVENLAEQLAVKSYEVAKKLKALGVEQPDESEGFGDWMLDFETVQLVSSEFNHEAKNVTFREEALIEQSRSDDGYEQHPRSAVVTIMGHVDHGKTSLLDVIRRARVAAGEAGGITQHIGAYTISVADAVKNLASQKDGAKKDKKADKKAKSAAAPKGKAAVSELLTFLDTPGHAAFTSMRARGASVTDIVVLVVSAVDGVMPQTREAVDHAKAAGVPIIVAVNKVDLPEANPDRSRQQLSELGLLPEDWGGETIFVNVSAKTGEGVDKLLEMIQIQAELLELKARTEGPGEGIIIEAKLDKGRGPVATVLIQSGQLQVGDFIVAGTHTGKVRALIDDKGKNTRLAGPSTPVEILGLSGVPEAGDMLNALEDEKAAKELAGHREEQKRAEMSGGASLEDLYARMTQGELKELPVIVKADVKGSAEAIQFALQKLPQGQVRLKILSASVGAISESDVLLASASKAVIFGFNVRPDAKSQAEAERRGVQIKCYTVIYDLIDEVTKAMEGLLAPTLKETLMGHAEVRNVFNLSKVGTVAGCAVVKGKVQRSNQVRLVRDGRVIYTGKLSGLKRFKDDAREVAEGYECGISIENYNDIKQGDIIEAFMVESIATALTEGPTASA